MLFAENPSQGKSQPENLTTTRKLGTENRGHFFCRVVRPLGIPYEYRALQNYMENDKKNSHMMMSSLFFDILASHFCHLPEAII